MKSPGALFEVCLAAPLKYPATDEAGLSVRKYIISTSKVHKKQRGLSEASASFVAG